MKGRSVPLRLDHCCDPHGQHWYHSEGKGIASTRKPMSSIRKRHEGLKKKMGLRKSIGTWSEDRREVLNRLGMMNLNNGTNSARIQEKSKKMKKSRCYICRRKGHAYWNCSGKVISKMLGDSSKGKEPVIEKQGNMENITHRYIHSNKILVDTHLMVLGSDSNNWDGIWYVNKTITKHMAQSIYVFKDFKTKYHKEVLNGEPLRIYGIGNAVVVCDGNEFLTSDVSYAPDINVNILSLPQLKFQGFGIEIHGNKCKVVRINAGESSSSGKNKKKIKDKIEEMERDAALGITKRLFEDYISKFCDQIGGEKGRGFNNKQMLKPNESLPSHLKELVDFIDLILANESWCANPQVKQTVSKQFDQLVAWFYEFYLQDKAEKGIPPVIGHKTVCLLDMFKVIKELGGAGEVAIQDKWNCVAMALGYPEWYDEEIKECYTMNLQQIEIHYDVAKRTQNWYEKTTVMWKGNQVQIDVGSFEGFIQFMEMVNDVKTAMRYRDLFRQKFDEMIVWFHKNYLDFDYADGVPPKIGDLKVCLFDLEQVILSMGGSETVSSEDQWGTIAMYFGFPSCLKNRFKGIHEKYLSVPELYYRAVKSDFWNAQQDDCDVTKAGEVAGTKGTGTGGNQTSPKGDEVAAGQETGHGFVTSLEVKGTAVAQGEHTSEQEEVTEGKDTVNIIYDDGDNLIITIEGGSKEEAYCSSNEDVETSDEVEPLETEGFDDDYVIIDSE